jgi:hypothetical protein
MRDLGGPGWNGILVKQTLKMDKTAFSVCPLADAADESDEKTFWQDQTPEQRLQALEFLRQVMYGYDPTTERLQRVLTVAQRTSG